MPSADRIRKRLAARLEAERGAGDAKDRPSSGFDWLVDCPPTCD